jgi:hypothetical protein
MERGVSYEIRQEDGAVRAWFARECDAPHFKVPNCLFNCDDKATAHQRAVLLLEFGEDATDEEIRLLTGSTLSGPIPSRGADLPWKVIGPGDSVVSQFMFVQEAWEYCCEITDTEFPVEGFLSETRLTGPGTETGTAFVGGKSVGRG